MLNRSVHDPAPVATPPPSAHPAKPAITYTVHCYDRKTLRLAAEQECHDTLNTAIRRARILAGFLTTNRADVVTSHGRLVGYVDQGRWIERGTAR